MIKLRGYPAGMRLALFVIACNVGYLATSQSRGALTLRPFVATAREDKFGSGGELAATMESLTAHRQDGSWVYRYTTESPTGERGWHANIVDVSARKILYADPFTTSVMTFYPPESELVWNARSRKACDDAEVKRQLADRTSATRKMLNQDVRAVGTRMRDGTVIRSMVAEQFDCYALAETVSDARGGRSETRILSFTPGDPPVALFQVPPGYTERSPRELEALWLAKYGQPYFGERALANLEARYHRQRGN